MYALKYIITIYIFQVMSKESLAALQKKQADMEQNNQNPWTFKQIAQGNMLGIRKVLSPFDLRNHGRFTGKFHLPGRVWQTWGTEINTVILWHHPDHSIEEATKILEAPDFQSYSGIFFHFFFFYANIPVNLTFS